MALRAFAILAGACALTLTGAALTLGLPGPLPVVALGGGALGLSALLAFLFSRWVSAPLSEIAATADRLASGDLGARVRSRREDELGSVARAIDRVAGELERRLREARQKETHLRAILEAMVEAVVVTDEEGRIVLSNAAFTTLAGEPRPGSTVVEAVRSPELHEAVDRAGEGRSGRVTITVAAPGRTRVLDAAVSPLPAGAGVVVVLHDVTELRRTDAVRRDFVANASHELRTPLTSIRGFAETLEGGALEDPAVARRFVRGIVENAGRLEELVRDLVELSRAESPDARIERAPVPVAGVARRVVQSLEERARARRVTLTLEPMGPEVVVLGDPRALDQVLTNLVENGIKYTREGGHVTVRASLDGAEDVLVVVRDDGPGIAEQHLPRLFERFYRVDHGRAREAGGTGLGLSIVKHLVGRMHGDVSVESRVGKGTSFKVRLRRAPGGLAQPPAAGSGAPAR